MIENNKTCRNLGVLRIVRVILFDVILHICDSVTDLLQIYFLFQGKMVNSQIKLHTYDTFIISVRF